MKIILNGTLLNYLLEKLDQIVNTESQHEIRVLKDLLAKLKSKEADTWWEMLKKFLRKEPCWVADTIQAVKDIIVTYVVDCTLSLEEMIKAGDYYPVNSNITKENFPIKSTGADEWEFKIFHFDLTISSEDAVNGIRADDTVNPWQPANIEHLLVYGKYNPKKHRKLSIVGLGSVGLVDGHRRVPCLSEDDSRRVLYLGWWDFDWLASCRFLGVRKKVSKSLGTCI
ncbi:MAG: hypothetical protein WCS89_02005 [Candidatus Paceibacterota bacterium]|jgi:hypothetical protein